MKQLSMINFSKQFLIVLYKIIQLQQIMRNINQINRQYFDKYNYEQRLLHQQLESTIFHNNKNAILNIIQGNLVKAYSFISHTKILLSKLQSNFQNKREIKISTLNTLCNYHTKKLNYIQALKFINQAIRLQQKQPINRISFSRTLFNKCILLIFMQKTQKYLKIAQQAFQHLNIFINQAQIKNEVNLNINEIILLGFFLIITEVENLKINKEILELYRKGYELAVIICSSNSQFIKKMLNFIINHTDNKNLIYADDIFVNKRQYTEYQSIKSTTNKHQNRYLQNDQNKKYKLHTNRINFLSNHKKIRKQQFHQASDTVQPILIKNKDNYKSQKVITNNKKMIENYNIEKKKNYPPKRQQKNIVDQMKELQKIKRIYQPLKSRNKISYIYQPNILEGTSKFQFLMLPINNSLCTNENNMQAPDISKNKTKHKSIFQLKQERDQKQKISKSKQMAEARVVKKFEKFQIKTKRTTQSPTIVTIESAENLNQEVKNNFQNQKNISKLGIHQHFCNLI